MTLVKTGGRNRGGAGERRSRGGSVLKGCRVAVGEKAAGWQRTAPSRTTQVIGKMKRTNGRAEGKMAEADEGRAAPDS